MHKFISFIKEFRIPKKQELIEALSSFSRKGFLALSLFVLVAFVSMLLILNNLNNKFLVDVPINGGSITEGITSNPTLVNPVIAISNGDKDLVSLIYSGLMRRLPNGTFVEDLAESYTVSSDGLTYTFIINKNAKFHDGVKVTADDIIYTINKIKNPIIKSPLVNEWVGVEIEKVDDSTVIFKLKQPYISFLDNTTIGILPMHIWQNVKDADFNISPFNIRAIGSGPYKFKSVQKNKDGIPTEYSLKSFSDFIFGTPHIKNITIISFSSEKDLIQAIMSGSIDQAGSISPKNAELITGDTSHIIHTASIPRIFGLFYNTANNKIFADANVIKAFSYALDKQEIIDKVLYGYGTIVSSPIPETIIPNIPPANTNISVDLINKANDLLDKNGWVMGEDGVRSKGGTTTVNKTTTVKGKKVTKKVTVNNGPVVRLEFSLTTGDTPELRSATEIIQSQLARIGAKVDIEKVYETGPLNQVIRDREYEALFFGQVINHESDLFSFWHSSQKKDPGLNIAMYSNPKVDKALEDAQKTIDIDSRNKKYEDFINEFNKDMPALLIYSPKYLYATSTELNNINLDTLLNPSDRLTSIYTWYANKDRVWKIFTK